MAAAGGGRYARLTAGPSDLDYLLAGEAASGAAQDENQMTDAWHEEGPWLVLLLLPLAALAFRRGWLFVAVLALLPLSEPVEASLWEELWLNGNQQAKKALEEGDAQAAAELFADDEWQAVARYRAGDYARSAEGFAENADTRNLYNLGNALAMQGEFDAAINAYERVLEIDPGDGDAAYNLELLRSAQEQQQQNREQGDQEQQSQQAPGEDGEQSNEPPDSEQASDSEAQADGSAENNESPQRPEEGATEEDMQALQEELERAAREAQEQQAEQQLTEEQLAELRAQQAEEQAMEQWLRRIPNDPGGLLRRKFRYQYQRLGKDQDGNALWPDDERQPW
jgi:Ca-activated chloride channel family protein